LNGAGTGTARSHSHGYDSNPVAANLTMSWPRFLSITVALGTPVWIAAADEFQAVERAEQRAALPLFQVIPAADSQDLTPHDGHPTREASRQWTRSHGDNGSRRFSSLTQINRTNVIELEVAWIYHSGDGTGNLQSNPLVVDGVIYTPTVGRNVVAIDGVTGEERWRFQPGGNARPAFRGLTWWAGDAGAASRLLFTAGAFLYALDPKTGLPIPGFSDGGRLQLPGNAPGEFGASTVAPVVFERTLIVPGFERDVWGFDVVTGKHHWTFHTIPGPGEYGADTWEEATNYGANCWGGMALDDQRGIAYLTTGSPKPNFNGTRHRGDNLFANCVVALDARTGRRLWHFQEIRHDIWDLDIPAPPVLTTITREGRRVDVLAAVTKLGNTLLLDRVSGQPVFPFRLRRAPTSSLPGETTAPYQPDVLLPEPFSRQVFTTNDITRRTPEAHDFVRNIVAGSNFGWFEPFSDGRPTVFFGIHGGAEWTGACVDPDKGHLYVSGNELPWAITVYRDEPEPPFPAGAPPTRGNVLYDQSCAQCHGPDRVGIGTAPPLRGLGGRLNDDQVRSLLKTGRNLMPAAPEMSEPDTRALLDFLFLRDRPPRDAEEPGSARPTYRDKGYPKLLDHEGYPGCTPPWGTLTCMDLNSGRRVWQVPLGEYPELTKLGIPKTGTENFGGPMVTAGGIVFCGGTRDQKIRAFDAASGAELWSASLPYGGYAPPSTYEAGGRQFVVIPATGGGKLGGPTGDALVAFCLPPIPGTTPNADAH
jgi:quinoprotein glucose dehydrogenase